MKKVLKAVWKTVEFGLFVLLVLAGIGYMSSSEAEKEELKNDLKQSLRMNDITEYGFEPGLYYRNYCNTTYYFKLENDGTITFLAPASPILKGVEYCTEMFKLTLEIQEYEEGGATLYMNECDITFNGTPISDNDVPAITVNPNFGGGGAFLNISQRLAYLLDQQMYDMCIAGGANFADVVAGYGHSAWREVSIEDMLNEALVDNCNFWGKLSVNY